jgi:hypothetical protein
VELLTGRPHQARVHLASIGHPLIGDIKYGDRKVNAEWWLLGIQWPMLHSRSIEFGPCPTPWFISPGKKFIAVPPSDFYGVLSGRGCVYTSVGIMNTLSRDKTHGGIGYDERKLKLEISDKAKTKVESMGKEGM